MIGADFLWSRRIVTVSFAHHRPAMVDDQIEVTPSLKLSLPVGDGGERSNHQEGATDTCILCVCVCVCVCEREGVDSLNF